jgi:hypothetical protein
MRPSRRAIATTAFARGMRSASYRRRAAVMSSLAARHRASTTASSMAWQDRAVEPDRAQREHRVRLHRQAGAHRPPPGRALEEAEGDAGVAERQRGDEAADAAAGDEDEICLRRCHRPILSLIRRPRECARRLSRAVRSRGTLSLVAWRRMRGVAR